MSLGIGEAVVTVMNHRGAPTPWHGPFFRQVLRTAAQEIVRGPS